MFLVKKVVIVQCYIGNKNISNNVKKINNKDWQNKNVKIAKQKKIL